MTVVETHETIDRLLEQWRPNLGADFLPYRNHVYRVFNLSCRLASATEEDTEKLAIAAAFHDIGIWMDKTFDYLEPSSRRALDYLEQVDRQDWSESIHQIID
ncbi:MAG: HD domain-containing protein [Armatimonadota bacterium]